MSPVDDDEELRLFRDAVRDVRPLEQDVLVTTVDRPRPKAMARFARADRQAVLKESLDAFDAGDPAVAGGEEIVFQRPGIQDSVVRNLRRGHYRVQAEIDLHGLTAAEAKQVLREFVAEAVERQLRCVRIIHGKGLRSGHRGPVLKGTVSGVLKRLGVVLAYVSARQVDGGTGAVYVLLAPWDG